jgi:hypothetical protein
VNLLDKLRRHRAAIDEEGDWVYLPIDAHELDELIAAVELKVALAKEMRAGPQASPPEQEQAARAAGGGEP